MGTVYRRAGPIVVFASLAILAGRLFRLTYRYSVNIFLGDQWEFHDADLFQKHSLWEMFRWQFGPHRLGLGPLLSKLVEPSFSWNSRAESFITCTVVTLAALCAVWLKKRLFGRLSVYDIVIPVFYLSAIQFESLFVFSNFAHGPLPLLLITLYCLAWTATGLFLRYVLVLALNFVIIYTGFGVFLGLLTPPLLVFDYWSNLRMKPNGLLYFIAGLLVSCSSMASFFLGYTLQPAVHCFSLKPRSLHLYPAFVSLMYANFWANADGLVPIAIGLVVVLWLIWTFVTTLRAMLKTNEIAWLRHAIPATLVSFSLMFAINAAYGRLCTGLESAQASRYANYLALGIFGAYLNLFTLHSARLRNALLSVAVVLSLTTLPIRARDRGTMRGFSDVKRKWKSCYLAGGSISECNAYADFQIEPEPEPRLREKLEYLKRHRLNLYAGQ